MHPRYSALGSHANTKFHERTHEGSQAKPPTHWASFSHSQTPCELHVSSKQGVPSSQRSRQYPCPSSVDPPHAKPLPKSAHVDPASQSNTHCAMPSTISQVAPTVCTLHCASSVHVAGTQSPSTHPTLPGYSGEGHASTSAGQQSPAKAHVRRHIRNAGVNPGSSAAVELDELVSGAIIVVVPSPCMLGVLPVLPSAGGSDASHASRTSRRHANRFTPAVYRGDQNTLFKRPVFHVASSVAVSSVSTQRCTVPKSRA